MCQIGIYKAMILDTTQYIIYMTKINGWLVPDLGVWSYRFQIGGVCVDRDRSALWCGRSPPVSKYLLQNRREGMVFAVNTASERANSVTSFCSFSMYIIYEVKDSLYEQRYQSMFIGLAWGNKRLTWDLRCRSSRCPTLGEFTRGIPSLCCSNFIGVYMILWLPKCAFTERHLDQLLCFTSVHQYRGEGK